MALMNQEGHRRQQRVGPSRALCIGPNPNYTQFVSPMSPLSQVRPKRYFLKMSAIPCRINRSTLVYQMIRQASATFSARRYAAFGSYLFNPHYRDMAIKKSASNNSGFLQVDT
jgi:hypothetical protein